MRTYIFGIFLILLSFGVFIPVIVKSVRLEQNCTGYLKRAADANTIEMAKKELKIAIDYIEANNLTNGYTSVLYRTPDDDLGFWYSNIKASYDGLCAIDQSTATELETSNMLMKLRETLLDDGEDGAKLTVPDGTSRYPNNRLWMWLKILASVALIGGGFLIFYDATEY